MFNKQFNNRMMPSQNSIYSGVKPNSQFMPIYQPEMNYYSQDSFYDNRSLYSATTATSSNSMGMNQNLKKKILADINSLLSGCIENIIPKLVDECADNIFTKISIELDKQAREIEDIKCQILNFDEMIGDKCNPNRLNTPMKNIKKAEVNINQIGKIVSDQKSMIEELQKKEELLTKLHQQLIYIKDKIMNENLLSEKVNSLLRDKNVDLLDMKRFMNQKVSNMSNQFKASKMNEDNNINASITSSNSQIDQIINLIDQITKKTNKQSLESNRAINHKTVFSEVDMRVNTQQPIRREENKVVKRGKRLSFSNSEFTF